MNILIIDDEPLVLQNVAEQVRDMGFDPDRVDCAGSASAADALLIRYNYDIFLCDIVMPGEDGISFAKRTLTSHKDCKFIFLTAHADYQYMKEAISIQSFDYVLQPVTREELKRVLENAIRQLKIERKNRELMQVGKLFENEQEDILDGNATRYLLGLTDNASFLRHLIESKTGCPAEDLRILPSLIHVIMTDNHWSEQERRLLRTIYYNVVDELTQDLESDNIVILRSDRLGNFMLLLCFRENPEDMDRVKQVLDTIRVIFQKSLGTSIALYYNNVCSFDGLQQAFSNIIEEEKNNVTQESDVYLVGQLSRLDVDDYSLDSRKRAWKSMLENNELPKFLDSVLRFVSHKSGAGDLNREVMVRLHQIVTELVLSYMVNNNINSKDIFDEKLSYTDFMYCWNSSEEFKDFLTRVVEKISRRGKSGDVILDITNYIEDHLNQEIYVSEIADYIGMNSEYLTRYFKKAKGMSLKKFIDSERMQRAIDLLEHTDHSVTEISEMVGYSSYSNFTRAFKQHTGNAPSAYRQK